MDLVARRLRKLMEKSIASKQNTSPALLVFLFLFFFVVPVIALGPFLRAKYVEEEKPPVTVFESSVSSPLLVNERGSFLKVAKADDLAPRSGQDFLAIAWFNFQDLPIQGEKMFILSRFDYGRPGEVASGYAIALSRSFEMMRPEVYWSDGSRKQSGWYSFAEVKFLPGQWFMLALSFYKDKYLGVFVGGYDANGRIKLQSAGGYELERSIFPSGSYPLKVGSVKTGLFTGSLGPVGIFSKPGLSGDLKSTLKDFLKAPDSLPDIFDDENILFWSPDGKRDLSPLNHEIRFVEGAKSGS